MMYQLTQLASDLHRQRLTEAEQRRPGERLLALARATRRTGRQARRMRAQLEAQATHAQ